MQFPRFRGTQATIDSAVKAAAILAKRQAQASASAAQLETIHAAYRDALNRSAIADGDAETPEVKRTHAAWAEQSARCERAAEAVAAAEAEHAKWVQREGREASRAEWDAIEKLTAARTAAGEVLATKATELAETRAEFERLASDLYTVLPVEIRTHGRWEPLTPGASSAQAQAELARVAVIPDQRKAWGCPPSKPLAEMCAEIEAMVKQMRAEATGEHA